MSVSESAYYDITPPVVSLIGSPLVYLEVGATYYEVGATATDDHDGDITNKISVQGNVVNVNVAGTYVLNYVVQDNAGNLSSVTRTVNVLANAVPTVAFGMNGNATYAKTRSTSVTVSDNVAVNPSSLEYQWTTSTTAPTEASFTTTFTNGATLSTPAGVSGGYYLWILAKDTNGNTMIARSNMFNLDNTGPTITFGTNGNTTYAKTYSTTVTPADTNGVNASSLEYQWTTSTTAPTEASFTTTFTSGGTISTPAGVTGGYYLWILAKDNLTNTSITRSNVFNLDNTGPVITITGNNPFNFTTGISGTTYVDPGATASDSVNGNLTSSIVVTNPVNIEQLKTYTVTYTVADALGNSSTATRTVNVNTLRIETIMWGAGGGGGGTSSTGAVGGGGAYAYSLIDAGIETLNVSVGAAGNGAANGCLANTGYGAGGAGTYGAAGGNGGNPSATECSSPGGGGGAGSLLLRSSTILVAAGGGGGVNGGVGYGCSGGVTGAMTTTVGGNATTPSYDSSAGGGGGGGYKGGGAGGQPSADGQGGCGGGGGSSYATTIMNGSGQTPGNSADALRGTAGQGGGKAAAGTAGKVIIRYYGAQKATGGTITSSGGYTLHTYTSSGTFTVTAS